MATGIKKMKTVYAKDLEKGDKINLKGYGNNLIISEIKNTSIRGDVIIKINKLKISIPFAHDFKISAFI